MIPNGGITGEKAFKALMVSWDGWGAHLSANREAPCDWDHLTLLRQKVRNYWKEIEKNKCTTVKKYVKSFIGNKLRNT